MLMPLRSLMNLNGQYQYSLPKKAFINTCDILGAPQQIEQGKINHFINWLHSKARKNYGAIKQP